METMVLAELIRDYIDKAIEYEFALRDIDEDGYTSSANEEEKAKEEAFIKLKEYLGKENKHITYNIDNIWDKDDDTI